MALLLGISGCDQLMQRGPLTPDQMEEVRLRDVAELYREHQVTAKKPPRSIKDFRTIGEANAPSGYGAIRNGQVVVRWQATLPDLDLEPTSPPSDQVLAYVKTVPEKGGPVLMLDRRIRYMTAEEFKAAKLAGTEAEISSKRPKNGTATTPR
jgi:hypothetical protein